MTEIHDDGNYHKWFKENYFDKDNVREAMSEYFQISENDIKKFEPKKKKKKR
jgi:molybdenum cofactor biosynthesis enzyme MoaA